MGKVDQLCTYMAGLELVRSGAMNDPLGSITDGLIMHPNLNRSVGLQWNQPPYTVVPFFHLPPHPYPRAFMSDELIRLWY